MSAGAGGPVRVALVNDYEIVVKGLARMFHHYHDRVKLVELDSRMPVSQPVDIALLDTFAQPAAHQAAIANLQSQGTVDHVVIYSWNLQDELVSAAMDRGAAGYLSKALTAAELVEALERVHAGQRVYPQPDADCARGDVAGDWPGRAEGLSAREAEVIALITQGMSNDEIARRTYLSVNSVKTYIRSAYRKTGITRRSQAVLWGVRHGFEPDTMRVTHPLTR